MPERIQTAQIQSVNADHLEIDDTYPGTLGFTVHLSRDPGPEWGVEFIAAYESAPYLGKPPVMYRGDTVGVFYLPRYAGDLGSYFKFLSGVVQDTNRAVDLRNSVLPDEEDEKAQFRVQLREAAKSLQK